MAVDTVYRSVKTVIAVIDLLGIGTDSIQGYIGHMVDLSQFLPGFLHDGKYTFRDRTPGKIIFIVILAETDPDGIVSGSDQTLLDLFIGTLDRRDDRDDRGDADNYAQHSQEGSQFMAPDALKGKRNVFKQCMSLLSVGIQRVQRAFSGFSTVFQVFAVGKSNILLFAQTGENFNI